MHDYHVHTHFSSDCDAQMEAMVQSGIAKNLTEICFTDHVDYDYDDPSGRFDFTINYGDWDKAFSHLKEHYKADISLKKGIELGIQPHLIESSKQLIKDNNFDFVLMSMHTCERKDLYTQRFFEGKTPQVAWLTYLEEMTYCAESFDDYSVLGHLDILKRYNKAAARFDDTKIKSAYLALFDVLIKKGKGLEVNTSSFSHPDIGDFQPVRQILSWYRLAGGEIITTGSDSHNPDRLGFQFATTYRVLRELGFTHYYRFEKMAPIAVAIPAN